MPEQRDETEHNYWVDRARELRLFNDDLEIDEDEKVSVANDGAWVRAWVWVPGPEDDE